VLSTHEFEFVFGFVFLLLLCGELTILGVDLCQHLSHENVSLPQQVLRTLILNQLAPVVFAFHALCADPILFAFYSSEQSDFGLQLTCFINF